jgi:hypothetical protein
MPWKCFRIAGDLPLLDSRRPDWELGRELSLPLNLLPCAHRPKDIFKLNITNGWTTQVRRLLWERGNCEDGIRLRLLRLPLGQELAKRVLALDHSA